MKIIFLIALLWGTTAFAQLKDKKSSGLWTVQWSPDNRFIATGGDDSVLRIYNVKDFSLIKSVRLNSAIRGAAWHPSWNYIAVATLKGVVLYTLNTEDTFHLKGIRTGGRGIGWNHSGSMLALADGGGVIRIFDKNGTLLKSIAKHNNNSYLSMDWHPQKDILVTGSDEIIIFDTSGKQLAFIKHRREPTGVLTVQWHPSGDFFASGDYGHHSEGVPTLLQFWKEDGTLISTMKGSMKEYRNIRWSKDGKKLATASDELRIWSDKGKLLKTGKTKYDLWGIDWNPEGDRVITSSFQDDIDLWDSKGKHQKKLK